MRKATYEDIKNKIKEYGCELISTEYKNAKDKITIKFSCGHTQETTYDRFRKITDKTICKKCKKIGGKTIKLTYQEVKINIEKEKYLLLSDEYKNAHTPLEVKCPKGHEYSVDWANWQQGYRCPYCGGTKKKEFKEIKVGIKSILCKFYNRQVVPESFNMKELLTLYKTTSDKYIKEIGRTIFSIEDFKKSFTEGSLDDCSVDIGNSVVLNFLEEFEEQPTFYFKMKLLSVSL